MAIYQTARFKVRPESVTKCSQAIREFVAFVKANEPETLMYISLQQQDDPTSFPHYFVFQGAPTRDVHADSEAVQRFTAILDPETLAPVEFAEYTLVAST